MVINCFADEIAESYQTDWEQAILLFRDRVRQNQKMIESDYAFTASRLSWDRAKTNTEYREVSNAMTLMAIAGTPEQQLAKESEAKIAAEVAEKELPKLLKQREAIDAKIAALERDRDLSAKSVEATRDALAKLPNVAPGFLRKRVAAAETLLNTQGVGAELRDATARHQELVCILNHGNVFASEASHIDALRRLCPDAVRTTVEGPEDGNRTRRFSYSEQWPSLKTQHEHEYSEVNQRLPELQAAFDTALAAVRKPLIDYFMNPEFD